MENKSIASIIYSRRKELGLTQQALADKLHVTNKAISKWETDEGLPDISIIKELATALDISIDELFNGAKIQKERITLKKSSQRIITLTIRSALLATFFLPFISIPLFPNLAEWLIPVYDSFYNGAMSVNITGFNMLLNMSYASIALTVLFGLQLVLLIADLAKIENKGNSSTLFKVAHGLSLFFVLSVTAFCLLNAITIKIGLILLLVFTLSLSLQGLNRLFKQ